MLEKLKVYILLENEWDSVKMGSCVAQMWGWVY